MDLDDTKLEISIELPSSNPSHDQTPVAGVSSVSQDESRGLNEMSAEDLNSLKEQVHEYAREDKWKEAESIFNKYGEMVRIPLTDDEDTALHVAVKANSISFVKGLVNLMTPQDLQIKNWLGETAFCMAAASGNNDFVQTMIEKTNGPEHDVATKLFEQYPDGLAIARCTYDQTALEMVLRKPSKELSTKEGNNNNRGASSGDGDGLQLFQKVWHQVTTQSDWTEILELMDRPSVVLADAFESGNVEAAKWLLSTNIELLIIQDNGQNILHYAFRKRRSSIVSYIFKMRPPIGVLYEVDKDGNNILHLAAYPLQKEETSSTLRPTTRMTREVKWFKQVEKKAPPILRTVENNEGKTPKDVFHDEHKDLSKEVKDTAKGIADSGMLVAALVATVAFAAALVAPGDKTSPWFIVFILANAAALFTSSASILSFLSNFTTSRFADVEFVIALHPSLILGPMLLLISIVTMVISFAAASFLIFEHTSKWVAYVVTSMGVFPILLFLLFQFSIFDAFIWSRFYRMSYAQ